jgi:hypothetical protein
MDEKVELFNKLFVYAPVIYRGRNGTKRNVYNAFGKHILQNYLNDYVSAKDFKKLMAHMGINEIGKTGYYPYRCRPQFYFDWA